jgi:hypothetical protein
MFSGNEMAASMLSMKESYHHSKKSQAKNPLSVRKKLTKAK